MPSKQPDADGGRVISIEEVLAAIRKIRYGSVLVKVHQGRIVGYEVTEKVK